MKFNKFKEHIIVCTNTDIPAMTTHEFTIFGTIKEKITKKESNILTNAEIFDDFTFNKRERFELISKLIKRKLIKRIKINNNCFEYITIPVNHYTEATEMRIYKNLSKKEKYLLIKKNN